MMIARMHRIAAPDNPDFQTRRVSQFPLPMADSRGIGGHIRNVRWNRRKLRSYRLWNMQERRMKIRRRNRSALGYDMADSAHRTEQRTQRRITFDDDVRAALSQQGRIPDELDFIAESLFTVDDDCFAG